MIMMIKDENDKNNNISTINTIINIIINIKESHDIELIYYWLN